MAEAICLRCGNQKTTPWETCKRCGYDPHSDEEGLVKSVYLSVGRFLEPDLKGAYRVELDRVGAALERGDKPIFQESELARLRGQKKAVERIPRSAVWGAVLRLFLPAIGFLLLLLVVTYLLRTLK